MNSRILCALLMTFCMITQAQSEPVYLVASGERLYRHTAAGTEVFEFDNDLHSMHADLTTGTVYAIGRPTGDNVYIIENALSGTPWLNPINHTSDFFGSLTQIGSELYGFSHGDLYQLDLDNPAGAEGTFIGSTGYDNSVGATYDPDGDVLYMTSFDTHVLYEVDYADATPTELAPLDVEFEQLGMDWWNDQLYTAVQNGGTNQLEVGTIDPDTGAYQMVFALPRFASIDGTALAIVPEPATLSTLFCLTLLFFRKR